jgi:hypothetical protein
MCRAPFVVAGKGGGVSDVPRREGCRGGPGRRPVRRQLPQIGGGVDVILAQIAPGGEKVFTSSLPTQATIDWRAHVTRTSAAHAAAVGLLFTLGDRSLTTMTLDIATDAPVEGPFNKFTELDARRNCRQARLGGTVRAERPGRCLT